MAEASIVPDPLPRIGCHGDTHHIDVSSFVGLREDFVLRMLKEHYDSKELDLQHQCLSFLDNMIIGEEVAFHKLIQKV